MIKHRTVLQRTTQYVNVDGLVTFDNDDEDNETPEFYTMSLEDWIEFGRPDTITLTVELGDLLNEST